MIKRDKLFINHILDSINAISNFLGEISKDELENNRLIQNAVIRELEVIGEAVKNISDKNKKNHSSIAWKQIAGMRDKLIHHYFGVDLEIIWETIQRDLPELRKVLEEMLKDSE